VLRVSLPALALLVGLTIAGDAYGQARGRAGGPPATARAAAPKDFTGYWVAVVTEHWHLRMEMPPKGDFSMLPVNAEARRVAGMWDPAQDQASGNACRAYGAAAIMRVPGRLHITWADDNTLKIETDSGTQTRLLHFGAGTASAASATTPIDLGSGRPEQGRGTTQADWQGYSAASWPGAAAGRGGRTPGPAGNLSVTTTRMRPGYLRKNGVPYSESAVLQEYIDTFTEPNGDSWLVVTSIITDPQYLTQPYATTNHFKKVLDNASGWDPTPCRADQPR
jgi:hypothetical protein